MVGRERFNRSKVEARFQAIFPKKGLDFGRDSRKPNHLWGKETGGEGFERVEKKEETEKRPEAESDQERQSELKGERWKF